MEVEFVIRSEGPELITHLFNVDER